MANNEIKAALRTFYREKSNAVINLSGLSLAIACFLVLGLYLKSELTYDRHNLTIIGGQATQSPNSR